MKFAVLYLISLCHFLDDSTMVEKALPRNGSAPNLAANLPLVNQSGIPHALSYKDVSRIWSNEAVSVRSMSPVMPTGVSISL